MHQVMFQANAGNAPKSAYYYSGLSLADEQLMKDAFNSAAMAVALKDPEATQCKDVDLYQIAVSQLPASFPAMTSSWRENWTFWVCGKLHDIGVRFEPDANGKGTRVFVDVGQIKPRP